MKKLLLLICVLLGLGTSGAWAAAPAAGKVYTIKAYFSDATDLYFANNGTLVFNSSNNDVKGYWVARSTGNATFPWKFQSGYDGTKYLSSKNGLSAVGGYFQINACATHTSYNHIRGSNNADASTSSIANLGTWDGSNSKSGFSSYGSGSCWASSGDVVSKGWTTDYAIEEVEDVTAFSVESNISSGSITIKDDSYTGLKTQTNGGVFILTTPPSVSDFTASVIANTTSVITIDMANRKIIVTYSYTKAYAKTYLDMTGPGCPASDASERTALQSAYDESEGTIAVSVLEDYWNCTSIDMPEDGKYYTLTMLNKYGGTEYALVADGTTGLTPTSGGDASTFYCHKFTNRDGAERYAFINPANGYIIGYAHLTQYYNTSYKENDFTVAALSLVSKDGSVITCDARDRLGYLYITSDHRGSGTYPDAKYCYVIKAGGGYDSAQSPFFNSSYSSAIKFVEVSYAGSTDNLNLAKAKLDAINYTLKGGYTFGTTVGTYKYTDKDDIIQTSGVYDAINACTTAEQVNAVKTSYTINFPVAGYYRIKNKGGGTYMGVAYDGENKKNVFKGNITAVASNTDPSTIIKVERDGSSGIKLSTQGLYGQAQLYAHNVVNLNSTSPANYFILAEAATPGCFTIQTGKDDEDSFYSLYNGNIESWYAEGATEYWLFEEATSIDISLTAANDNTSAAHTYATLCVPFNITNLVGANSKEVKAYAPTKSGDYIVPGVGATTITEGTPVLLIGAEGATSVTATIGSNHAATPATTNVLTGTFTGASINCASGSNNYVLGFDSENDNRIGFYHVSGGSSFALKANRAYLNTSAGVKGFAISFGDTIDSIKAMDNTPVVHDGPIFNLAGQRINKLQRGVNIVKGKKVIVK